MMHLGVIKAEVVREPSTRIVMPNEPITGHAGGQRRASFHSPTGRPAASCRLSATLGITGHHA